MKTLLTFSLLLFASFCFAQTEFIYRTLEYRDSNIKNGFNKSWVPDNLLGFGPKDLDSVKIGAPFPFASVKHALFGRLSDYSISISNKTSDGIITAGYPILVSSGVATTLQWQTGSGSTQWHPIDTLECGVDTCTHDWVHSKPWQMGNPNISCAAIHPPGYRCNYGNAHQRRKSICRKCCFHILESDEYVPVQLPTAIEPEDEYEKLVKKQ